MELTDQQLDRYARHLVLRDVGGPGQRKLLHSSVLVIGAGGLGCPIIAYLAAAGIGRLGIVDDDRVELSNLQRQILFATGDVGQLKADLAARRAQALNQDCAAIPITARISSENAQELIAGYDLVIDGTDNFATRLAVSDACMATQTPLISAAIAQFEGQLAGFSGAPGDPCYRCYVPAAPPDAQTCEQVGVMGAIAGILGSMAALEAVKIITGAGTALFGKLILYDALGTRHRIINIRRDPACPACGHLARQREGQDG